MSGLFSDFGGLFGAMSNEQSQCLNNAAMANAQRYRNQMMQNIQAAQNPLMDIERQLQANAMAFNQAQKRPTVAQTAASRVDKPDWEKRADAKDKELNEWLYSVGLGHIAEMDFSSAHNDDVL